MEQLGGGILAILGVSAAGIAVGVFAYIFALFMAWLTTEPPRPPLLPKKRSSDWPPSLQGDLPRTPDESELFHGHPSSSERA